MLQQRIPARFDTRRRSRSCQKCGLAEGTQNSGTAQGTSVLHGDALRKIVNQRCGLALGIDTTSTAEGYKAMIWGDNGTTDRLWQVKPALDGYYKIAN